MTCQSLCLKELQRENPFLPTLSSGLGDAYVSLFVCLLNSLLLEYSYANLCEFRFQYCPSQGCKEAGEEIFSHPTIKAVAEKYFLPVAFNTWDQSNSARNAAFRRWSGDLMES